MFVITERMNWKKMFFPLAAAALWIWMMNDFISIARGGWGVMLVVLKWVVLLLIITKAFKLFKKEQHVTNEQSDKRLEQLKKKETLKTRSEQILERYKKKQ